MSSGFYNFGGALVSHNIRVLLSACPDTRECKEQRMG